MDAVTTDDCCAVSSKRGPTPDLVVIGAGSAGFSAAIRASELGARVALIGAGTIGGTCVNIGCVPSKTLIRAAGALHHARTASRFEGIEAPPADGADIGRALRDAGQSLSEQVGAGGLAVGAGDSDDTHVRGRLLKKPVRDAAHQRAELSHRRRVKGFREGGSLDSRSRFP